MGDHNDIPSFSADFRERLQALLPNAPIEKRMCCVSGLVWTQGHSYIKKEIE